MMEDEITNLAELCHQLTTNTKTIEYLKVCEPLKREEYSETDQT